MLLHREGKALRQERWERAGSPDLQCMGGGKDAGVPLANPLTARAHSRQRLRESRGAAPPAWHSAPGMLQSQWFPPEPCFSCAGFHYFIPSSNSQGQLSLLFPSLPSQPAPCIPWQCEVTSLLDLWLPFWVGGSSRLAWSGDPSIYHTEGVRPTRRD